MTKIRCIRAGETKRRIGGAVVKEGGLYLVDQSTAETLVGIGEFEIVDTIDVAIAPEPEDIMLDDDETEEVD